ncbi:MAG TPA: LLM class flavin-dependent oxidoreductase [Dehalococcoidia bacterium]|nr:LLM class flavin-dependent oxidoreductase [Dehalococcoidia bacterium]
MEFGSFMEFHVRPGRPQSEAFEESFAHVQQAEMQGLHGVWLAESHFTPGRAVLASPLIIAAAIAGATKRMQIGTAVHLLPLGNPIRMAEDVATLDHVSNGRLEFGVGRSSAPGSYEGYGVAYAESKDRMFEALEVMKRAWTQERFSFEGEYYHYDDVCLTPKPYQQPHPPIRVAATTDDTFPVLGEMGASIFIGLRTAGLPVVMNQVRSYIEAWRQAGHAGEPDIALRVPVYVAETAERAVSEPQESFMRQFRRLGGQLASSVTAAGADHLESRSHRAEALGAVTWEDAQREKVAIGTPSMVIERLQEMQAQLNLNRIVCEFNAGEQLPREAVAESLALFCAEVMPAFAP